MALAVDCRVSGWIVLASVAGMIMFSDVFRYVVDFKIRESFSKSCKYLPDAEVDLACLV